MTTLLHISDTHFGTEIPAVLAALRQQVHAMPVDAIILSGDLTQRARLYQFRNCRAFIDSLSDLPLLAVPGNHDISLWCPWERLFTPYRRYHTYFPTDFDRHGLICAQIGDAYIVAVRSTRRYRHIHGELSARQIDRVGRLLQQAPAGALKLVVCHQPLYVTDQEDEVDLVRGAHRAVPVWRAAGADGIVSGHIHQPFIVPIPPGKNALSTRPMWAIQTGTTASTRLRDNYPNAFNIISNDVSGLGPQEVHNPLALPQPDWLAGLWLYDFKSAQFLPYRQYWIR
ncbi:MAG: metallophosphoesterase [bacterium]|nr:metallophosphoesterase [bacterium]